MDDSRASRGLVPDCTTFASAAFLNATVCTATTTIAAKAFITAIASMSFSRLLHEALPFKREYPPQN